VAAPIPIDRQRLYAIIDRRHDLVGLTALMPWSAFDESFWKILRVFRQAFCRGGGGALGGDPDHQYFCGFAFFQHRMPIDPS
jgi:hypothetical protein